MPLISVVIPSYNRKELTQRAVQSVLDQSCRDLEIIVVDDCSRPEQVYSPEGSSEVPIRVIRHEINQGVSAARNTGVQAANGELIAFLDSDDTWFPQRLEKQLAFFLQQPDRDNVLVYSSYYWKERHYYLKFPLALLRPGQAMSNYLFIDQGCLHADTWLAAKSLFARVPQNPQLRRSEDWDMLLRMERLGVRFAYCPIMASIRYCDGRNDRLSTTDLESVQRLFLTLNEKTMTPETYLIFESHVVNWEQRHQGTLARYLGKLHTVATSHRLGFLAKCRLVWVYFFSRLLYGIRIRLNRRPIGTSFPPDHG